MGRGLRGRAYTQFGLVTEAGAKALVVFNDTPAELPLGMRDPQGEAPGIPAVLIGMDEGEALLARLKKGGTVEVRLEVRCAVPRGALRSSKLMSRSGVLLCYLSSPSPSSSLFKH